MTEPDHGQPRKPCCSPSRGTDPSTAAQCAAAVPRNSESAQPDADEAGSLRSMQPRGGMVQLSGGEFRMGGNGPETWQQDGEGPVRLVTVRPFLIDACAVTNEQFAEFIADTGYVTEAERFGWSFVFHLHLPKKQREELRTHRAVARLNWWLSVPNACWKHPVGTTSTIEQTMRHPVVHVSWHDANAYARWAGCRLPSEAEWEYAARGGLDQQIWPWGNRLLHKGRFRCNIFQGRFPDKDTGVDGYRGTCPVDAYEPNSYGLYNVIGNVWEWCDDWFSPDWHRIRSDVRDNPRGPATGTRKSQRGGSYLCHDSYCNRYRISARIGNTPDTSGCNVGFRCVRDV